MHQDPSKRRSLLERFRRFFSGSSQNGLRAQSAGAGLGVEALEDRMLLSVTPFLSGPNTVTFQGDAFSTDDVYLRVVNGILEHSSNGIQYERDVDPAAGIQEFHLDNDSLVQVDVGGTLFLDQFTGAGGTFRSLTDLVVLDDTLISSRQVAPGTDPLSGASIADSRHLLFEAPDIVVGTGAHILASADQGFEGGDIRLNASSGFDLTFDAVSPIFKDRTASASIQVMPFALIEGRDVEVTASTTTAKYTEIDFDDGALQNLIQDLSLATLQGNPELTLTQNGEGGDKITRSEGSWIVDGFAVAELIFIEGTEHNDGQHRVESVTDLELRLVESGALTDETVTDATVKEVFTDLDPDAIPLVALDRLGNVIAGTDGELIAEEFLDALQMGSTQLKLLNNFVGNVQGSLSASDSDVFFGNGSRIQATGDVLVSSTAVSDVTLKSPALGIPGSGFLGSLATPVAIGAGISDATSRAKLGENVVIDAGGAFSLLSQATNNLQIRMSPVSGLVAGTGALKKPIRIPAPALGIAYGRARTDSDALIASGSVVNAQDIEVHSTSTSHSDVAVRSKIQFQTKNFGEGVGAAISDIGTESTARVNGDLTAKGDITIDAESIHDKTVTTAQASITNKAPGTPIVRKFTDKLDQLNKYLSSDTNDFGLAAGLAVAVTSNQANGIVGPGAVLNAGENLTVRAYAEDSFRGKAAGGAGVGGRVTLAGAIYVGSHSNEAEARIDQNVVANAGKALTVRADAIIPNPFRADEDVKGVVDFIRDFDFDPPDFNGNNPEAVLDSLERLFQYGSEEVSGAVEAFAPLLPYLTGLQDLSVNLGGNVTTSTNTSAIGQTRDHNGLFALTGSINAVAVENEARASVSEGARLNEDGAIATADQVVKVDADAALEAIHVSGTPSPLQLFTRSGAPGAASDGSAVGTSIMAAVYDNKARAWIADDAIVHSATDVSVDASSDIFSLGMSQAGSQSTSFGFAGSFALHDFNNDSRAWVEESADITAQRDIQVDADSRLRAIDLALAFQKGEEIGVGASVVVNDFDNTTMAFIGDFKDGGSQIPGMVQAGRDVSVTADSFQLGVGASLAGAIAKGSTPSADTGSTLSELLHDSGLKEPDERGTITKLKDSITGLPQTIKNKFAGEKSDLPKTAGVGLSGDAAIHLVSDDTQAFIANGITVQANRDLEVEAEGESFLVATTLALSVGGSQKGAAIAGSGLATTLDRTTKAYTENVTLDVGRDLSIQADSRDRHLAVSAGGGGASPSSQANSGIAGALNLHVVINDTDAHLGSGTVADANGEIAISAKNEVQILSIGGAVAITGQTSLGGGADLIVIDNAAEAEIGAGAIARGQNVRVEAENREDVLSLGAGVTAANFSASISGSAAVSVVITEAIASIGEGALVVSQEDVVVSSDDATRLLVLAGSAGGSLEAAAGVAFGGAFIARDAQAFIDDDAMVTAFANGGANSERGVVVEAEAQDSILAFSASAQAAKELAIGASFLPVGMASTTEAWIGRDAQVNAIAGMASADQMVTVRAESETDIISAAGAIGVGLTTAGIGAAAGTTVLFKEVSAFIDDGAVVSANGNVIVEAETRDRLLALSGSAEGGNVSGGGSVTLVGLITDVDAHIDSATVVANGSVVVSAVSDAQLLPIAGQLAIGAIAGLGASSTIITHIDTTEAWVGRNAQITALGQRAAVEVPVAGGIPLSGAKTESIQGLAVSAVSSEDVVQLAAAGSLVGKAGLAGSVNFAALVETTRASIGEGAQINSGISSTGSNQSVLVNADSRTHLNGAAGALGFGLKLGAGGGADVSTVVKTTEAYVDKSAVVNAQRDVMIQSSSEEEIRSLSGSAAGGIVGIGGAASLHSTVLTTRAYVDENAVVEAGGSIAISATDDSSILHLAGNFEAGVASIGGAVDAVVIVKSTEAWVGENAIVHARARHPGVRVENGKFVITYEGLEEIHPDIPNPDVVDPSLQGIRSVTPETELLRGVAVTAMATTSINRLVVSGGGAGGAIALSGAGAVATITTSASVDSGAGINVSGGDSGDEQSVLVAAGSDYSSFSLVGAGAAGLVLAVAPAGNVELVFMETTAEVGDSAQVLANEDIRIEAHAREDIFFVSGGVSAVLKSGPSLAGSASVIVIDNETKAQMGRGAVVEAGGNILVAATDKTETDVIAGAGALAIIGGSVGASVGITTIFKETDAIVDQEAVVRAAGRSDSPLQAFNGDTGNGNFGTEEIKGLSVQAGSSEDVFTTAVAGGAGTVFGAAGAFSVHVIDSNTQASIRENVTINDPQWLNGTEQSVNVAAVNNVKSRGMLGSLGGGVGLGAGGSADVGIVRNDTAAFIGNGSDVFAIRDVLVRSGSAIDMDAIVVSGGAAALGGLSGAVGIYSIASNNPLRGQRGSEARSQADGQVATAAVVEGLNGYSTGDSPEGSTIGDARQSLQNNLPSSPVRNATEPTSGPSGTSAFIGDGVRVTAGRDIKVIASDEVDLEGTIGAAAIGAGVTLGASVGILNVDTETTAFVGEDSNLSSGRDVSIRASFEEEVDFEAFVGSGALVAGEAQFLQLRDNSDQTAYLGSRSRLMGAQELRIVAKADRNVDLDSIGGAFGGVVGGASITDARVNGTTSAIVREDAEIGTEPGGEVGNVIVKADAQSDISTEARAVSGSFIVAGQVVKAVAQSRVVTHAGVDQGATVRAEDDFAVRSVLVEKTDADANGDITNLIAGAGSATANAKSTGQAFSVLGSGVTVSAEDVEVETSVDNLAVAHSDASNRGILGGVASKAKAIADPNSQATIGEDAIVSSERDIRVAVLSRARARADADGAKTKGLDGIVGMGSSEATAESGGVNIASVKSDAKLSAGRNVDVVSGSPFFSSGNESRASASGSSGKLIDSNLDMAANAFFTRVDEARVEDGAEIFAGRDVVIAAITSGLAKADSTNRTAGLLTSGHVKSNALSATFTEAVTGEDVVIQAGRALSLSAIAGQNVIAESVGEAKSGLNRTGKADAVAWASFDTRAIVGARSELRAGEDLAIQSRSNIDVFGKAEFRAEIDKDMDANVTAGIAKSPLDGSIVRGITAGIINHTGSLHASTIAQIGRGAQIEAEDVLITASADNLSVRGDADSRNKAGGIDADSDIVLLSTADVLIRRGALIVGRDRLDVVAGHQLVITNSDANEQSSQPLKTEDGDARNAQIVLTRVRAANGSKLQGHRIRVAADGPVSFTRTDGDRGRDEERRTEITQRVHLNAAIVAMGRAVLKVNRDGTIEEKTGIFAQNRPDEIVVNGLKRTSGSVVIEATPTVRLGDTESFQERINVTGNARIRFKNADRVVIDNRSNKRLRIRNLEVKPFTPPIDLQILCGAEECDPGFSVSAQHDCDVEIDIHSTGNVIIAGPIRNNCGHTGIRSQNGRIVAQGGNAAIHTKTLKLRANQGSIGTEENPIRVFLSEMSGVDAVDAHSRDGTVITIVSTGGSGRPFALPSLGQFSVREKSGASHNGMVLEPLPIILGRSHAPSPQSVLRKELGDELPLKLR